MNKLPSAQTLAACILLLFISSGLQAQGSSTSNTGLINLRGQVTDFSFRSPVSSISLVVTQGSSVTNWTIEAPSAAELRRLGWNSSSLFTGEIVNLRARPLAGLPQQAELVSLIRANGAILLASVQNDTGHLDLAEIPSGLYSLDRDHSYLIFSYDHRGYSRPQLRFDRFSASLNLNTRDPETSTVRVEVDVSSLDSGVAALDQELRGQDFFDSLNHPRISFRSTGISLDAWGHATLTGEIEIKGRRQSISLDAQLNRASLNPETNMHTLGVSLTGTLLRSNWGMDRMTPLVSDEVQVRIEAEFVQPAGR